MLEIVEVTHESDEAMSAIGKMHVDLLHFGPFAALGETYVREVCYRKEAEEGVLKLAIARVDGEAAGFIAYTSLPFEFHKSILHKHWARASWMALVAILKDVRRLAALPRIGRTIGARIRESHRKDPSLGEIVCVAVRPGYLTAAKTRAVGERIPESLLKYAARDLYEKRDVRKLRMIVDADNKHALFMYHALGARFEKLVWAGEEKTDVYFDLVPGARIMQGSAN